MVQLQYFSYQSLESLAATLKKKLPQKGRKWKGDEVKQCFVGSELVDYMVDQLKKSWGITSRVKAVGLGRALLESDFIQKLGGQNRFEDAHKFYYFTVSACACSTVCRGSDCRPGVLFSCQCTRRPGSIHLLIKLMQIETSVCDRAVPHPIFLTPQPMTLNPSTKSRRSTRLSLRLV